MQRDRRAARSREWECGRAAGPGETGREIGDLLYLGIADSSKTELAHENAPLQGTRIGSAGPEKRERTDREWEPGNGWEMWNSREGLLSWALLEVSLKPSQLFPGCRLRRCLGQGSHLLRSKEKGGDRPLKGTHG